jgi:hypothetical protein
VTVSHAWARRSPARRRVWRRPGGEGTRPLATLTAGAAIDVGALALTAPDVPAATVQRLELEVQARDGRTVARSYLDVSLLPRPAAPDAAVTLWADSAALAGHLRGLAAEPADGAGGLP